MTRGQKGGPKSANGKTRSSRNAYRHGILSVVAALTPFEQPEEWEYHRDGTFDSLDPQGHLECVLTENIAWTLWKMLRVVYYQQMVSRREMDGAEDHLKTVGAYAQGTLSKGVYPDIDPVQIERAQATRTLPPEKTLVNIMRYEAHLHRMYIQTLHELEAMQARRRGEPSHLARLDISVPPGG